MNASSIISAVLLLTLTSAIAKPNEMERRLQEQERQIARLETENSQLWWLVHRRGIEIDDPSLIRPDDDDAAPTATKTSDRTHLVKKGDSLSVIARRAGTSPERLVLLNEIKNPELIEIGQRIRLPEDTVARTPAPRIPSPEVATHIVAPGETLYRISINHGMKLDRLLNENPDVEPHSLQVGQKLRITSPTAQATEATNGQKLPIS